MSSTAIIFTLPSLHFPPLRFPGCPPIFITYVLCCTCLHPSVPSSPPSLHLPRCPTLPSTTPTSRLDHFMPISSTPLIFTLLLLRFPPLHFSGFPHFSHTAFYPSVPSFPPSLHLPGCPAPPSTTPTSRLDHFMPISSTALIFTLPLLRFPPLHLSGCPPFSCTAFYHSKP